MRNIYTCHLVKNNNRAESLCGEELEEWQKDDWDYQSKKNYSYLIPQQGEQIRQCQACYKLMI